MNSDTTDTLSFTAACQIKAAHLQMTETMRLAKQALADYHACLTTMTRDDETAVATFIESAWSRYARLATRLGFSPNYLGYLIHNQLV